jgi:hypothetical protein
MAAEGVGEVRHGFSAEVLADSITPSGVRVTTLVATLPRAYLAELNTHRLISRDGYEQELSRNSASSRAIPTEQNIAAVREHPYVPTTFNARVKGMGVGEEFDADLTEECRRAWMRAMHHATTGADALNELGLDKSRANRLIEPFMWHTVIMTATEWENFLALRCPDGDNPDVTFPAQLEMQEFALCVRNALRDSQPKELEEASWHAPYFDWDDEFELLRGLLGGAAVPVNEAINGALLVSARRCARVSFVKQDDVEELLVSYDKGVLLADMGHYSPMEHQVRPITHLDLKREEMAPRIHVPMDLFRDHRTVNIKKIPLDRCWSGNLRGVIQFRKLLPGEDNAMLKRIATAAAALDNETA